MNFLLDTNILLLYLRENQRLAAQIDALHAPLAAPNTSVLSVVTAGEIRSIAIQSQWGVARISRLFQFVQKFPITDIHVETIIQRYAEIDAFSQGRLPGRPLGTSARNMGKNDPENSGQALWIAATASVLGLTLLTTDHDFHHLDGQFFDVIQLDLAAL
ncbi:MAG: type II toxin-antitoxin system VapC family toxin [Saprospiraceae bacterium]|nr:MAG: type II toxin-antitoxin system VapC family toxin [Saprospiraceae bacterium]